MNLKKISSIIVIVAMLVSMVSFTGVAGTGATAEFALTYENITDPGQAIEKDDLFFAVVKLKNSTTMAAAQISLEFAPAVVQLARTTGLLPASFTQSTDAATLAHSVLKVPSVDLEIDVAAMEMNAGTIDTTTGKVVYTISAAQVDGAFNHYTLTADQATNGLIMLKIRFKALNSGDAAFAYTTGAQMKYQAVMGGAIINPTTGITALTIAGVDQPQDAPTGLVGVAPTSALNNDGKITGTTTAMEYKLSADADYITASATETTGLVAGAYDVRYAAKTGFLASPSTPVTISAYVPPADQPQDAPTGLVGVAPTSALTDGKITGTTALMEYKLSADADYITASATETTGLVAGAYDVRYAAKTGFLASPSTSVTVSAYVAPPLSTNANLSALSVTGATLNETFDANTLLYTATVANDVTSVTINATKSDSKATVAGDGAQSLSIVGVNTFNVVVTAENTSVKTYVVKITRQTPPVDGAVVKAGDVSGYIEQNVTVPVTITKMTGLDNFDVKISYETSALTYFSGIKGPSITGATEITHSLTGTTGEIIISGLAVGNGSIGLEGDIVVANITFTVKKGIAAGSSIVKVLAGIYNTTTVADTNFTDGTITYTLATDQKLLDAIQAVDSFETTVATTIADITTLLGTEQSVRDTVNLVTLPESQTAKLALIDKIDARSTALKAERTALQAEKDAADLVLAYEDALLTTLDEVATAEGKKSPAFNAVDALRESPTKVNLLSRIGGQDTKVANARIALTKIAKLVLINAGTATLADYQVIAPSATEALLANYKRGVEAQGSALTETQVIALVLQVNTPAEPVITHVKIIGQAVTGSVLTATYEYYDANYDLDPGLGKTWTVTDGNPVKEETYTVALGDVGKTITVSVWNVPSVVSLPVIRRGDITMDNKILSRDAFFLREIFNETFTKTDTDLTPSPEKIAQYKAVADYDNNGIVNALDLADVLINSEI